MERDKITEFANLYKNALLNDVIPFWEKNSVDWEYGGYFTALDREGKVYDTDKFAWLQARQVWTFSFLYNQLEKKEEWLAIAGNGIRFLRQFGRDDSGSFHFSFTRDGQPLTHAYSIYSDCFAALAFTEYARATGEEPLLDIGLEAYRQFIHRQQDPKGRFNKTTGARPLQSFGLPMMTAFLTYELEPFLDSTLAKSLYEDCIRRILYLHYQAESGFIYENIGPDGQFMDTYEGRLINPGHGLEAMWFLMDIARKLERPQLMEQLAEVCIRLLEHSWDKHFGGIFYFMDSKGAPLQQLEWDQKLWWVHQEALIALALAYQHTGKPDIWDWYQRVHDYAWTHFPDPEFGEWYGYLNRQGTPVQTLKGGKWKGCFHTPRALYRCWRSFEAIRQQNQ